MLSRFLERKEKPVSLPENWTKKFHDALNEQYKSDLEITKRKFEVFTELYPDEICLGICLIAINDENSLPVTYIVSSDISAKISPTEILDKIIDSAEIFYDQFFANETALEYEVVWLESEYSGVKFHYLISRENLVLTKMADELLNQ